ncbi:MAG: hypothetical protein COB10_03900 [Planctomycetota bacterium]|nr:MAG: hypothetical protein COB10_03900 [Planctomycetota bacterium]HIC23040.1 LysM domain-containing protein [Planctomycetota bacterium]
MQYTFQHPSSISHRGVFWLRLRIPRLFLPLLCILMLLAAGCSAGAGARGDSALAIDESVGPADFAAMATGSWQIRDENQRGMVLLGGLLAYDMTTTEKIDGRAVAEKRISAGPLWIAGTTETRALQPEAQESHGNWFFPFWRYRVENGKKTLYPLMVIPIPMGKAETSQLVEYDDSDAPWQDPNVLPEDPITPDTEASYGEIASIEPVAGLSPAQAQTYRLRQGDTLWSLAVRFYGDGHRYRDILVANQTTIPDVEAIPIGTTILLPR